MPFWANSTVLGVIALVIVVALFNRSANKFAALPGLVAVATMLVVVILFIQHEARADDVLITLEPQLDGSCRFSPSSVDVDEGVTLRFHSNLTGMLVLNDPTDLESYQPLESDGGDAFELGVTATATMPPLRCSTTGVQEIVAAAPAGAQRDALAASLQWPELQVTLG
jgi:hypothetical protein